MSPFRLTIFSIPPYILSLVLFLPLSLSLSLFPPPCRHRLEDLGITRSPSQIGQGNAISGSWGCWLAAASPWRWRATQHCAADTTPTSIVNRKSIPRFGREGVDGTGVASSLSQALMSAGAGHFPRRSPANCLGRRLPSGRRLLSGGYFLLGGGFSLGEASFWEEASFCGDTSFWEEASCSWRLPSGRRDV